jgi:hypothetical protein
MLGDRRFNGLSIVVSTQTTVVVVAQTTIVVVAQTTTKSVWARHSWSRSISFIYSCSPVIVIAPTAVRNLAHIEPAISVVPGPGVQSRTTRTETEDSCRSITD